jgi:TPR repeat protein
MRPENEVDLDALSLDRGPPSLAELYENPVDTDQIRAEVAVRLREAAEQGNAHAQYNLGVMYDLGRGVGQSYAEATNWLRKASEQNLAEAQCYLGVMYGNGEGVAQDDAEAVKWFRRAAEQNNAQAQYNLGLMYDLAEASVKAMPKPRSGIARRLSKATLKPDTISA